MASTAIRIMKYTRTFRSQFFADIGISINLMVFPSSYRTVEVYEFNLTIAEDEPVIAELLSDLLAGEGYRAVQ
jgi:hypothetical protein